MGLNKILCWHNICFNCRKSLFSGNSTLDRLKNAVFRGFYSHGDMKILRPQLDLSSIFSFIFSNYSLYCPIYSTYLFLCIQEPWQRQEIPFLCTICRTIKTNNHCKHRILLQFMHIKKQRPHMQTLLFAIFVFSVLFFEHILA